MVAWSIIGHLAYKSRRCYRRGLPRAAAACSASGHGRGCRCLPRLLLLLLHLCAHERLELAAHATHKGAEAAAAVQLLQQPLQARHCRLARLHCSSSRARRGRVGAADGAGAVHQQRGQQLRVVPVAVCCPTCAHISCLLLVSHRHLHTSCRPPLAQQTGMGGGGREGPAACSEVDVGASAGKQPACRAQ